MQIVLNIDLSNQNALALINYIKTLDFIKIENMSVVLSDEEKRAVDVGLKAAKKGKTIEHGQLMSDFKNQFPDLFK